MRLSLVSAAVLALATFGLAGCSADVADADRPETAEPSLTAAPEPPSSRFVADDRFARGMAEEPRTRVAQDRFGWLEGTARANDLQDGLDWVPVAGNPRTLADDRLDYRAPVVNGARVIADDRLDYVPPVAARTLADDRLDYRAPTPQADKELAGGESDELTP